MGWVGNWAPHYSLCSIPKSYRLVDKSLNVCSGYSVLTLSWFLATLTMFSRDCLPAQDYCSCYMVSEQLGSQELRVRAVISREQSFSAESYNPGHNAWGTHSQRYNKHSLSTSPWQLTFFPCAPAQCWLERRRLRNESQHWKGAWGRWPGLTLLPYYSITTLMTCLQVYKQSIRHSISATCWLSSAQLCLGGSGGGVSCKSFSWRS